MKELRLKKRELDLLAGCPPCQGFSTVRTKNGRRRPRDDRNQLLFDFLRFARVLRPKAIMLENVPGLAGTRYFRRFCGALRRLGYGLEYRILNAAAFGVPQRRKRLLLLGVLGGAPDFAVATASRLTVREAIGHLARAGKSGDPSHDHAARRTHRILRMIRAIPKNGGGRRSLPRNQQLACHRSFSGFNDIYGRMKWDEVAPTITGGCINPSKGRFLHPTQDRAITLREAALLQGSGQAVRFPLLIQADFDKDLITQGLGDEDFLRAVARWEKSPEAATAARSLEAESAIDQVAGPSFRR
jgi:DNA (cytosine-5)-methyltransferase 1